MFRQNCAYFAHWKSDSCVRESRPLSMRTQEKQVAAVSGSKVRWFDWLKWRQIPHPCWCPQTEDFRDPRGRVLFLDLSPACKCKRPKWSSSPQWKLYPVNLLEAEIWGLEIGGLWIISSACRYCTYCRCHKLELSHVYPALWLRSQLSNAFFPPLLSHFHAAFVRSHPMMSCIWFAVADKTTCVWQQKILMRTYFLLKCRLAFH